MYLFRNTNNNNSGEDITFLKNFCANLKVVILVLLLSYFGYLVCCTIGVLNSQIAYAEEITGNCNNIVMLEEHTSSDNIVRFASNKLSAIAEKYDLGVSMTNKNKGDHTQLTILSSMLEGYKIDNTLMYIDIDQLISEKKLIITDAYVGSTKNLVTVMGQYSQDEILTKHDQLQESLKQNIDGKKKIIDTSHIFIDNLKKPHEHVIIEYTGKNNIKVFQAHTITTHPILSKHFISLFYGNDLGNNYIHAGNSPFVELAQKELDSYVARTPKIFYFNDIEIKKTQAHVSTKVLNFCTKYVTELVSNQLSSDVEQIVHLQKMLDKNRAIQTLLKALKLIPENLSMLSHMDVQNLGMLSKNDIELRVFDTLTNIPKTKLTTEAQPVFNTIQNSVKNQTISPYFYNLHIPTVQFNNTPQNLGINTHKLLSFNSTNYAFMMKSFARAQQLF